MRAMTLREAAKAEVKPLELTQPPPPSPGSGEILVEIEACGVCRTDLHVIEGDLESHRSRLIPGHEIVGRVLALGPRCKRFTVGDRVGVAWLHRTCGTCRFCVRGDENLCLAPTFTGWDVDGGYAELVVAAEEFAYPLSPDSDPVRTAPLLCAGIIGYRAYVRSRVRAGARLGLFGFGGSAHIVIQIARHQGCDVYVFSRGSKHRHLAEELGAVWVGDSFEKPPHLLDGAILFAPVGDLVAPALEALDRGGMLAIAGIHLSDVPTLRYQRHLFQERGVQSVTANTRRDGEELLKLAHEIPIVTETHVYPLERANEALIDLKSDRIRGAGVLVTGSRATKPTA